eukprot:568761-Rhodomonas_salina.1
MTFTGSARTSFTRIFIVLVSLTTTIQFAPPRFHTWKSQGDHQLSCLSHGILFAEKEPTIYQASIRPASRETSLTIQMISELPSVAARRKKSEEAVPRVPRNYSERLYSLRDTIDEGTEVPLLPMRQLLKKCATSAKHGYEWATVDRGLEVLHLIVASGLRPDLDCYRYLFQIAAEDCWQGLLSHERVRQLYEAMKKEEGVTVRQLPSLLSLLRPSCSTASLPVFLPRPPSSPSLAHITPQSSCPLIPFPPFLFFLLSRTST